MSFYNHRTSISNTTNSISPFYFDKIYTSRLQMDNACADDGVYLGRFVLVKYGIDDEHKSSLNNGAFTETLGNTWAKHFWDDAIEYWKIQESAKFETDTSADGDTYNDGKHYYLNNGEYTLIEENTQTPAYDQNTDYYIVKSSVNVLGYDNTVWQKNLVNDKMQYVMVSSLYSPEIDMTANLLNGELISGQGVNVDLSWPGKNNTPPAPDPGYHYTYTFDANIDTNSGLKFDGNNKIYISLATNSGLKFSDAGNLMVDNGLGLERVDNKLKVKLKSDGGLDADDSGLGINLADSNSESSDSGLKVDNNGLKIQLKYDNNNNNNSGLRLGGRGLFVNASAAGGLKIDDDNFLRIKLPEDVTDPDNPIDKSGLKITGSGLSVRTAPRGGLKIDEDGDGLKVNLIAGSGIQLSSSLTDNSITIINSAPNADLAANEINLVGGTDYDIFYFNNVFLTDDYDDAARWNKWYSANQHYIYVADGASPQSATQQNIETYHITTFSSNALKYPKFTVNLIKDPNSDNIISGYFNISDSHFSQVGPIVNYNNNAFTNTLEFNHTRTWDTVANKKTWLFAIRFKGNYSSLKNKTFIQSTSGLNGIWNIGRRIIADSQTQTKADTTIPVGASWNATCRMARVTNTNTTKANIINSFDLDYEPQAGDLIFFAASYGDGYNQQIDHWAENIAVADKNLYISNINFTMDGNIK